MEYVIAGVAGLAYGALCSLLKYLFIWRPFVLGKVEFTTKSLTIRQIFSMAANVIILLSVYFLRNVWPYSFEVTIICTAVALSVTSKLYQCIDSKKNIDTNKTKLMD